MPRRPAPKYAEVKPPIEKLDNVPGPEASADVLKAHYGRVQEVFATHRYDDVIEVCHWCLDGEAGLAFTKTDQPRGTRQYCSARCANGYSAYMQKVVVKGRTAAPSSTDETEDDSYDPPPGAAQPQRTRKRRKAGIVDEHYAPVQPGSDEERAALESATTPLPKGAKLESAGALKPRKARATQAAREDGKCPRGLHDLTPDNVYEHNGVKWCRECKKLNRAKYLAKKSGS